MSSMILMPGNCYPNNGLMRRVLMISFPKILIISGDRNVKVWKCR